MNGRFNNRNGGYSQNRGNNVGNRQFGGQPRGGQGQQGYVPNTGKLRVNHEKQSPKQPDFKGVGNVEINGEQHTVFLSLWFNQDQNTGEDTIRLTFTPPNSPQVQGYPQNGSRQNAPNPRGGNRQNGHSNGGGNYQRGAYTQQMSDDYTQQQFEPRQGGAMSRARPIPQPQYDDGPPPYDAYPDGPIEPGGYEPDMGQ